MRSELIIFSLVFVKYNDTVLVRFPPCQLGSPQNLTDFFNPEEYEESTDIYIAREVASHGSSGADILDSVSPTRVKQPSTGSMSDAATSPFPWATGKNSNLDSDTWAGDKIEQFAFDDTRACDSNDDTRVRGTPTSSQCTDNECDCAKCLTVRKTESTSDPNPATRKAFTRPASLNLNRLDTLNRLNELIPSKSMDNLLISRHDYYRSSEAGSRYPLR